MTTANQTRSSAAMVGMLAPLTTLTKYWLKIDMPILHQVLAF
jgi:hypothetical protein